MAKKQRKKDEKQKRRKSDEKASGGGDKVIKITHIYERNTTIMLDNPPPL